MHPLFLLIAIFFSSFTIPDAMTECRYERHVLTSAELRSGLTEASASKRFRATQALGGLGCGYEALVIPALASPYRDVVLAAVRAVGNCPTDATLSLLRALLRNEGQDRYVQIAVCEILGDMRDLAAFGVLDTLAISTHDSEVRDHAIQAATRIARPGFDSPRIYRDGRQVVFAFLRDDVVGAYLEYDSGRRKDVWSPAEIDTLLCLLSLSHSSDSLGGGSMIRRYKLVLQFRDKTDLVFDSDGSNLLYSAHDSARHRSGAGFSTCASCVGTFFRRVVQRLESGNG